MMGTAGIFAHLSGCWQSVCCAGWPKVFPYPRAKADMLHQADLAEPGSPQC